MTRTQWALLTAATIPAIAIGTIAVTAFGPLGAIAYGTLLAGAVNARLFRERQDTSEHRHS